jgi:CBS-domain-containing membrane protein
MTTHGLTVRDVMTRDVDSVRTATPFKSVVWTLVSRVISGAPVLDCDGVVIGVVTEADLLPKECHEKPARRWPFGSRRRRSRARKAKALTAGELMSAPAVTIEAGATIPLAAATLARHSVKRLPVVDSAGRLVGVVSRQDVLRAFLRADDEIAREVERDVIRAAMSVDPASVEVRVCDGVVHLCGQLERKSMVAVTEALTREVTGVVGVVNELTYAEDDIARRWIELGLFQRELWGR